MKWIIDRFEGDMAIVECNGQCFDIPRCILPPKAKEGDEITLETNDKSDRRDQALKLMNKVFFKK